jgi:hypothetical protein
LYGVDHALQVTAGTKQEWGRYWGRPEVGVLAVTDKHFAKGILDKAAEAASHSPQKSQGTEWSIS